MEDTAAIVAAIVAAANLIVGIAGGLMWWRVTPHGWFWPLARVAQVLVIGQALVAGGLALSGFEPDVWLYWLYALLPILVGFMSEGIRIASAEEVLDRRGLPDAAAVGELDDGGQRSVVVAIMRREIGVATLSALVVALLCMRAIVEI